MSWAPALILTGIVFSLACFLWSIRPKRSNRHINLPPPATACRRNGPEAAP